MVPTTLDMVRIACPPFALFRVAGTSRNHWREAIGRACSAPSCDDMVAADEGLFICRREPRHGQSRPCMLHGPIADQVSMLVAHTRSTTR